MEKETFSAKRLRKVLLDLAKKLFKQHLSNRKSTMFSYFSITRFFIQKLFVVYVSNICQCLYANFDNFKLNIFYKKANL